MRLGPSATQIWREVNALARREGAINMGQGFPDFPGSRVAREAAAEALLDDDAGLNQYSSPTGLPILRKAVANFYERRYGVAYDADLEVVVCTSGQEALCTALRACIQRSGRTGVLLFEPFYPFALGAVAAAGGRPHVVRLEPPLFEVQLHDPPPDVGVVLSNTPHNPTGRVFEGAELDSVASLCQEHDLYVVSDEVYEHVVFDGYHHRRLADVEGMRERTCTVSSAGKLLSLTGWRVAWVLAHDRDLAAAVAEHRTHASYCAPTPLQVGVARALDDDDVGTHFGENFAILAEALGHRGLEVCPAQGGYFLVARTPTPDLRFVRELAEDTGVVCTPLSVFYRDEAPSHLVRFALCKSRDHVRAACARLLTGSSRP